MHLNNYVTSGTVLSKKLGDSDPKQDFLGEISLINGNFICLLCPIMLHTLKEFLCSFGLHLGYNCSLGPK